MSTKKSEKIKKAVKGTKSAQEHDDPSTKDPTVPIPEVPLEISEDIRKLTITIDYFRNILPLYPSSDVKVVLKYLGQNVGESRLVPVTDEENLPMNETFEIAVDVNSPKQLDQFASYPVFVSTIQCSGTLDPDLYEQLQKSEDLGKPAEEVESLFSVYEAFTGEKPQVQLADIKKKKKGKKEKSEKPRRDKSYSRSKSALSKSSKKSKSSSKTSAKTNSTEVPPIKSEVYGMSVIDLIPLFYGRTSFSETLLIQPVKRSCEMLSTFKNFPELTITVSVTENVALVNVKNILNFCVESICNAPTLMTTADMDCRICATLPLENNGASPFIFHNPKLTNKGPEKLVLKRWPGIQDIGYNANTTKYLVDTNLSNITNKMNLDLEEGFRDEATRIEYNYLKRNILFKDSNNAFAAHILTHKKMILEFFITPKKKHQDGTGETQYIKTKGSKMPPFLHLMAVLDLAALLYPGVTRLHVATPVTTFTYEEAAKGGLTDSFFIPKLKLESASSKTKLDTARKRKLLEKKEKVSKKDKASTTREEHNLASLLPAKPEESPPTEPSIPVYNDEGKPCFIVVEIELLKPLKPKRDVEELKSELDRFQLHVLQQSSKTILNNHVADDFYDQTIREIIDDINKKWIDYNEAVKSIPPPRYEDFQKYLQKVGVYQAYLNSIITSATLLITNKYKCEEQDFKNSKSYQNLLSEVFIDLISHMHGILNSLVCSGMKPLRETYTQSWDENFFNAKEAAELKLYTIADRYFMERIVNDQNNSPDCWFDYAIYNIEIDDIDKAFECVKESIAINCSSRNALLLFGALLAEKDKTNDAEICLLNILILEPKWLEAWCVLYLFYQKCDRQDGMEMALDKARKLLDERVSTDYLMDFEDLAWRTDKIPKTVFFRTAILLLKMRFYSWAELLLAEEVLVPKHYGYVNYLLAVASYYRKNYDHALEHLEEAKESLGADFSILALSGHALLGKGLLEEAKIEYLRIIESYDRPEDIHLVYLNCAEIFAKLGDSQKARKLVLAACKNHQTPQVWFRAGKLYFEQNDLLSAEECFNEANMKDNRHAEVWAYLTLINLKLSRSHEAEQCYQQAIKSKLDNDSLNSQIIEEFNRSRIALI